MYRQYVFIEWFIPNRGFYNNELPEVPSLSMDKLCLCHTHQHCRGSGVNHDLTILSLNNLHSTCSREIKCLKKEILSLFCSEKMKHEKWISYTWVSLKVCDGMRNKYQTAGVLLQEHHSSNYAFSPSAFSFQDPAELFQLYF